MDVPHRHEHAMDRATFLGLPEGVDLVSVTPSPSGVLLVDVVSRRVAGSCPGCGARSERVHSSYARTVADAPCADRQVTMRWRVHKFRCSNSRCSQQILTERFPTH